MAKESTSPVTYSLGENIRRTREAAGISQLALAHKLGRQGENAGAYICRIETDKTEPRTSTLRLIAKALDVTLQDLLPA
jgi:transcriptional regulator with XRE-family HTH domain